MPARAALDVVLRSARGELPPVVGVCPACGSPLVGQGPPPTSWTFQAGDQRFVVDGAGRVDAAGGLDALAERIRAAHPEPVDDAPGPWLLVFRVGLMVLMLAPIAVWVFSVVFVTVFLSHVGDK